SAFKAMKSDLGIRPLYHQLGHRVEAHIMVAFLAYCLLVTLKNRLQALAPGLSPRAVLEKLATGPLTAGLLQPFPPDNNCNNNVSRSSTGSTAQSATRRRSRSSSWPQSCLIKSAKERNKDNIAVPLCISHSKGLTIRS